MKTIKKPILLFIAIILILVLGGLWIAILSGLLVAYPYLPIFFGDSSVGTATMIFSMGALVGLPLILVIGRAFKAIYGVGLNRYVASGMWIVWIVSLVHLFVIGHFTMRDFAQEASVEYPTLSWDTDSLNLSLDNDQYDDIGLDFDGLKLGEKRVVMDCVELNLRKGTSPNFELKKTIVSRGRTGGVAKSNAGMIDYKLPVTSNDMKILQSYILELGNKYRGQQVILDLFVPEGKTVKVANGMGGMTNIESSEHHWRHLWGWENEYLKMTDKGLECLTCEKKKDKNNSKSSESYKDFKDLWIEGNMKVKVYQSDDFTVKLDGEEAYLKGVYIEQNGEELRISSNSEDLDSPIRLMITLPSLGRLAAIDTDDIKISGFEQDDMILDISGSQEVKGYISVDNLKLSLGKEIEVQLRGKGEFMNAELKDNASLDASRYETDVTAIILGEGGEAEIIVLDTLKCIPSEIEQLKYKGKPVIVDL